MLDTLFSTMNAGLRILSDVDMTHSVLRLVTFDTHLNVHKDKYLTTRNRLLSGKAGPAKILMF